MSDGKLVEESTPCMDTGSFMKLYLNPFYKWRLMKAKGDDTAYVSVVGSGRYDGPDKTEFAKRAGDKIVFMSYRNCFPKLPNGSTTDSYWGCLVRTGQMVVAQAFMRFYGGGCSVIPDDQVENLRTRVKPLFRDVAAAPFSIHNVEEAAHNQGLKYARWLSPTQACLAVAAVCEQYHQTGKPSPFPICCEDRNINKAQAYAVLRRGESVLFLVPVMMGIGKLNAKYQQVLLRCLDMEHFCGAAGGFGKASLYFFGRHGSSVFFLDPHYVQPAYLSAKSEGKTRFPHGSMDVGKLDPCMFIGFFVPNEAAFEKFLVELGEMNAFVPFPLISITEDDPRKKAAEKLDMPAAQVDSAQADRIVAVGDSDDTVSPTARRAPEEYPTEAVAHAPSTYPTEEEDIGAPAENPLHPPSRTPDSGPEQPVLSSSGEEDDPYPTESPAAVSPQMCE